MENYYYKVAIGDVGFPGGSDGKESIFNAGDSGLILGSGRSLGNGMATHSQYSCLENSMDGGVWWLQSTGSQRVGRTKRLTHK
jgi:hypothetical protein